MAWIESHQTLARHSKTKRAARLLGLTVPAMIGHLHCLWWWAMDIVPDGDLSGLPIEDIADGALWEGDPAQFIDALVTADPRPDKHGFLERDGETLLIHDWKEYGGKLLQKRNANRRRAQDAYSTRSLRADNAQSTTPEDSREEKSTEQTSARASSHTAAELQAAKADDESLRSKSKRPTPYGMGIQTQIEIEAAYESVDTDPIAERLKALGDREIKGAPWWRKACAAQKADRLAQEELDRANPPPSEKSFEEQFPEVAARRKEREQPFVPPTREELAAIKAKYRGLTDAGGQDSAAIVGGRTSNARSLPDRKAGHRNRSPDCPAP